jgi:hypothetical protein
MNQLPEILQIAESLLFSEDKDAVIWQLSSNDKYSVQTLYAVVSDMGVKHVFTQVIWKISVPPRLHVFMVVCQ